MEITGEALITILILATWVVTVVVMIDWPYIVGIWGIGWTIFFMIYFGMI